MARPRKPTTATGQQYGKVKEQEEMIAASEGVGMSPAVAPTPSVRPGEISLSSPSQRPSQDVRTPAPKNIRPPRDEATIGERRQALNMLPLLESAASLPHASSYTRQTVRRLRMFIGDVSELGIENE